MLAHLHAGKDIGTVINRKNRVVVTFVFRVVRFSSMLWALYCSDFNILLRVSSKMNVLSHSITHILQQHPTFDIFGMFR